MVKITACGFLRGHKAYIKSGWNQLDFLIVVAGLIEFAGEQFGLNVLNLKSLRTLRVLRPLKTLKMIPALKKQISALIRSMYGIFNVILWLTFVFGLFSIFGLTIYSGDMYYTCRLGSAPLPGAKQWPKLSDVPGS